MLIPSLALTAEAQRRRGHAEKSSPRLSLIIINWQLAIGYGSIPLMNELAIRLATANDVSQLAKLRFALRSRLGTDIETEDVFLKRCEAWMSDALNRTEWRCWVAVYVETDRDLLITGEGVSERLLGALWLQLVEKIPNPISEAEHLAYITNFYVTDSARGQGLGTKLLNEALDWCRQNSVHSVILWPTEKSRPLYQRHGFDTPKGLFELTLGDTDI